MGTGGGARERVFLLSLLCFTRRVHHGDLSAVRARFSRCVLRGGATGSSQFFAQMFKQKFLHIFWTQIREKILIFALASQFNSTHN